jgi:mannose-6-phosphate isomerase-like protein (cupin superfamily)
MFRIHPRLAALSVCFGVAASSFVSASWITLQAADSPVDPTFLYRRLDRAQPGRSESNTATCRYKPLFGAGDTQTSIVRGVARFGEMTVDAGGASARIAYPSEEQVYFVLEGRGVLQYGKQEHPLEAEDFLYLPPGVEHAVTNAHSTPLRILVMGYHIPKDAKITVPEKLLIANTRLAKKQTVGNHPSSTLYQLLMGDVTSKRDVIAAGHVLTSLFLMDIAPGGTNQPHHHPREEEIYLLLEGKGDMVAGGGADGVEGRHPATAGDAYFIRLNATVGFYADNSAGAGQARVLAVRSLYPGL